MDISEEEKEKRIEMAKRFEALFAFYFAQYADNERDWTAYIAEHYTEIAMLFVTATVTPAYIADHARRLAEDVTRVTDERVDKKALELVVDGAVISELLESQEVSIETLTWLSQDRAMLIAENESNTVGNYDELIVAIRSGMTKKTWNTMRDNKVRNTHKDVDGMIVDIFEPFDVGNSKMMFPRDDSLGASAEEIVNCRCHASYS